MISEARLPVAAREFVESVLALRPKVAVFDCDGTLWSGDSGADFFYWEIERGLLPSPIVQWALPRYEDYKAGNVAEEVMCGEMVSINAGAQEQALESAAEKFFSSVVQPRIFPEMLHLTRELESRGCELWAVSSTNVWAVRAGVKHFGVPAENVLAACVHVENGYVTDRLIRVPSGPAKATALREFLNQAVDICFGNSIHDLAMLEMAGKAIAVNPNRDLEEIAHARGWTIYWPGGMGREAA